jgi:hypothetical protein
MSAKNLANLYVGAFLQFTSGLIGWSGLWILMSPVYWVPLDLSLSFLFCDVHWLEIYINLGTT